MKLGGSGVRKQCSRALSFPNKKAGCPPQNARHLRCVWWHLNVFLSKQPYPCFLKYPSPGFQTPMQRLLPCLLVEILRTGPAIFLFLKPFVLSLCRSQLSIAEKLCILSFCHRTTQVVTSLLKVNIRQLISWIAGARATRCLILSGL